MATKSKTEAKPAKAVSRAVIVAGVRTPFVKAFGPFTKMDTIALGDAAVKGLLERTKLPKDKVEAVVWGGVILPTTSPNLAREIALDLGLPPTAQGVTVTRACASGLQAITDAVAPSATNTAENPATKVSAVSSTCQRRPPPSPSRSSVTETPPI